MSKKFLALALCLCLVLSAVPALGENVKHERVYIVTAADGTVKSLTDNIRLENKDESDILYDRTRLTGIQNLSGSEAYTLEGESLTWQAKGKDIIYQGSLDETPAILPLVSLTLDGETVSPRELKEKTGRARLTVSFRTEGSLPFLAVALLPLPENGMTGLETENALVLKEMGRQVLVGWAVPGAEDAFCLPAAFSLSFNADHTDLDWMMTFASADPVALVCKALDRNLDFDPAAELPEWSQMVAALAQGEKLPPVTGKAQGIAAKINELNAGLTLLNTSAGSLVSGAKDLADGITQLKDGCAQAKDGAVALSSGAETVSQGLQEAAGGALTLQNGLSALTANNEALNESAAELLNAALQSASAQLLSLSADVPALTRENYASVLDSLIAQENNEELTRLKAQLDQLATFADSLKAYTDAAAQAAQGAQSLSGSLSALEDGTAALASGAATLQEGTAALDSGAAELKAGAFTLQFGAGMLQSTGTKKLMDSILSAEKTLASQIQPLAEQYLPPLKYLFEQAKDSASQGYDLRPDGMDALTVYVIRTDLQ